MDPIQVLIDADQHISDMNYLLALQKLQAYAEWRFKGGFEPSAHQMFDRGMHRRGGDAEFSRQMTRAIDSVNERYRHSPEGKEF